MLAKRAPGLQGARGLRRARETSLRRILVGSNFRAPLVACLLALFAHSEAGAQIRSGVAITDADCALCHDGAQSDIPVGKRTDLAATPHAGLACRECHADITEIPHDQELAPATCGNCHAPAVEEYVFHGMGVVGETADIPGCSDCHGMHDIRPAGDPRSKTHRSARSQMCGACHGDIDLAREHDIGLKRVVEMYEASVHGMARAAGDTLAAVCTDCHGSERRAHQILGPGNSDSAVNHFNVPASCGQCHGEIADQYSDGVHGMLVERGETHAPVCTDCHGEHGILPIEDPRSNVSPARVAEATCTPCHESARINESYDLPQGTDVSYIDSYHGLKSRAGDVTVANCASCHGAHDILPSRDPASRVNPANLQTTCGECHPAMSAAVAQVPIHSVQSASPWVSGIRKVYLFLIVAVIGGMLGYVALDYRHQWLAQLRKPQVIRMSRSAVVQHTLLMVTFIILVITGFALRYSDFAPFRFLFGWDGGFNARGTIHRASAIAFIAASVWHLIYLFSPEGKRFLRGMLPGQRDLGEFFGALLHNLGRRLHPPRMGRFSFVEKAEYWALIWGTVVMVLTGLFLWFRNETVDLFSREFVSISRVIHLYEAWLATLAILVWHFYAVIFKPGVYPGNPAWVTGKMPAEMYEEEHPGDPVPADGDEPVPAKDGAAARGAVERQAPLNAPVDGSASPKGRADGASSDVPADGASSDVAVEGASSGVSVEGDSSDVPVDGDSSGVPVEGERAR